MRFHYIKVESVSSLLTIIDLKKITLQSSPLTNFVVSGEDLFKPPAPKQRPGPFALLPHRVRTKPNLCGVRC